MPHTTYGVLKAIRSHQVSSPRVSDELVTGRPNACNLCHLDKTLAWTAEYLTLWYGQPAPPLPDGHKDVADAVRLALAGDAGQRALVAWHFGWEPAVRASGKGWVPAILATLLDDSYAAVRCIAERSFRRVSALPLGDYDFTVPSGDRPAVRQTLLKEWASSLPLEVDQTWSSSTLVSAKDPDGMQQVLDKWMQQRDHRPVRLRE
jgi:hypothetical protein